MVWKNESAAISFVRSIKRDIVIQPKIEKIQLLFFFLQKNITMYAMIFVVKYELIIQYSCVLNKKIISLKKSIFFFELQMKWKPIRLPSV